MDISLLHAGLAAGAALAAVPVILHLFMKQTPKHIVFPALRLIRERQKRSHKKLRIKNWLLLLARMALVALMALALARPSLNSMMSLGDREVPTAIGLVFDTSLSMGYKEKDKTRLDEAKEYAHDILKRTPDSSEVFVIDSAEPGAPAPLSPASARKRVDGLTLQADNHRPLNNALGLAYTAVAGSDRKRKEVFVLTDLALSAWDTSRPADGIDKVEKAKKSKQPIATYVLRLAPKHVNDVAVVAAEPSTNVATQGETIDVRAKLRAVGKGASPIVEFFLDGVPKGKKPVEVTADGEAEVRFTTPKLDPGVPIHQGMIRIPGPPDPLDFDDRRYFTFRVQPSVKVLVLSDLPDDALYVAGVLDPNPDLLPPGTPRTCQLDRVPTRQFTDRIRDNLKDYTCVFINNVGQLKDEDWGRLNAYVREGGGLVIGLGNRSQAANYNGPTASPLCPATLEKKTNPVPNTTFGKVLDATHPLFGHYAQQVEPALSQVPVFHYWAVAPVQGSRTLLTYADGAPALIERTLKGAKTGRVLLWTTPLARRADTKSEEAWNDFPLPRFWPFVAILLETVPYMSGSSAERLNYEAGQDAILPIDPTRRFKNYFVEGVEAKTTDRISPPATSDALVIPSPTLGQWRVTASGSNGEKAAMGFSVNPPVSETQLTPLKTEDLEHLFGKDQFALADDLTSLKTATDSVRVGRELFPWLMALILLLVTVENLLANKFYRESGQRSPVAARA